MVDALNNQKTGENDDLKDVDIKVKCFLETLQLTTRNEEVLSLYEHLVLNLDSESKNERIKSL